MLEETIAQIKGAEDAAQKLLDDAEKERFLILQQAQKKAQAIRQEAERSAREEAAALRAAALAEAETQIKDIRDRSHQEKESLINKTAPRLDEARRLCQ